MPASSTGIGPDTNYIPIVKRGSRFTSQNNLSFVLTENIDFANSKNPTVVATVDTTTGAPTFYAIKSEGNVVSGYFGEERVRIGAYQQFLKIQLTATDVAEIISVTANCLKASMFALKFIFEGEIK